MFVLGSNPEVRAMSWECSVNKKESEVKETWKQPLTTVRNGAKDRQQFIPRILGGPPPE